MEKKLFQPLGGNVMPRFGGPGTMMRLPSRQDASGLDACFIGVPFDIGTSNRSGARFGPRQIRAESCLIRPYNMGTRAAPFDALAVADIGDVPINPYNLADSMRIITEHYTRVLAAGYDPREMPRVFELLDQDPEGDRIQPKHATWTDHPLGAQRRAYTSAVPNAVAA